MNCPPLRQLMVRRPRFHSRAFSMVEIAICLAIIGFALVAIIGVLPAGLQVQKDNREDTLIGQDGEYFMEAIRSGAMGLDNLVGNVETIQVNGTNYHTALPMDLTYIGSGHDVIGLLSNPAIPPLNPVAIVRAISGAAAQTGPAAGEFAFKYQLTVQQTNLVFTAPELDANLNTDTNINFVVGAYLHDLRLEFRWPVHTTVQPDGTVTWTVGNGRQVFRALVSGTLLNDPVNTPFYFFRP